jgi:hypothetical protein
MPVPAHKSAGHCEPDYVGPESYRSRYSAMSLFPPNERSVLRSLEAAVRAPRAGVILQAAAEQVRSELATNSSAQLAWRTIPLRSYERLPEEIASSWVFVLRTGCTTGAERHPNSIQRMYTYGGSGDMQIWDGKAWESHPQSSRHDAPFDERWITIPRFAWHRPVMDAEDWVVVSFHTAGEDELIEERAADDRNPDAGPVSSEPYAGRKAR